MITRSKAVEIHEILIKNFGGASGLRDKGALESALKRPFQSFEGSDLYPDVVEKAAALIESILTNHPFIDGNKRTGYVLMRLYLIENDKDVLASQEEKYEFVMNIASGKLKLQEIAEWLSTHTSS